MKDALVKKRYGIPAALLILLVLAGIATACVVKSFNCTTNTQEPLSFSITDPLDIKCQGDPDEIIVKVSNASEKTVYGIFVDAHITKGEVDSITYDIDGSGGKLVNTEQKVCAGGRNVNNDSDRLDAWYNIEPGACYNIVVTVDSADAAHNGELKVVLGFQREAAY